MAYTKQQKKAMSRIMGGIMGKGTAVRDQLRTPLTEGSRYHYDAESEDTYEYGFVDLGDMADEDVDRWFDEHMRRRIPSYMHWDCTGCTFTYDISWHRNPSGLVSFVHWMGTDY